MAAILVIDDEPDLVRFVRRALEAEGHQVRVALDGADGLRMAMTEPPELMVLDLVMPGVDGRAILAAMTSGHPEVPILVLSAEPDVGARVEVLEAGAVDFVAKPFAVRELLARVRNRLSRPTPPRNGSASEVLSVGSMTLDATARTMNVGTRTVPLSQREFLLLRHLMTRVDRVCTRQELLSEVWGYAFLPNSTNVVDVCVARLRHKLRGELTGDMIRTVRNVGYQLQSG